MSFPLIPFLAGTVVGGVVSYLYKDEKWREEIKRSADSVTEKVKEGAATASDRVSAAVKDLRGKSDEAAVEVAEADGVEMVEIGAKADAESAEQEKH